MKLKCILACILSCVLAQAALGDPAVDLFSDLDCASCNLSVPTGETRTFYIRARTELFSFQAVDLRVVGLPTGWMVVTTPNPAAILYGDLFGLGGVVDFGGEVSGDCVLLCTVEITATSDGTDVTLRVTGDASSWNWVGDPSRVYFWHHWPNNPSGVSVFGGALLVNSARECTVSVEPGTWGSLKGLYR